MSCRFIRRLEVPEKRYELGAQSLVAGPMATCAVSPTSVRCWGYVGGRTYKKPSKVFDREDITQVSFGGGGACALFADRTISCTHAPSIDGRTTVPARELDEVDRVTGDGDDGCALRSDGIWCWASYGKGHPPTRMTETRDIIDLEVDGLEGCAVTKGERFSAGPLGFRRQTGCFSRLERRSRGSPAGLRRA